MDHYIPLWDLPYPSAFSQLPDDDFLTLLQKQFPNTTTPHPHFLTDTPNPQTITPFALPSLSPLSEDSNSPSPPHENLVDPTSNLNANEYTITGEHDDHDSALKRKKSNDDLGEGPSSKTQHTSDSTTKRAPARRKSGAEGADESRWLKRKEQNRAAQRAFRERKEKHVKDLEDKVAALQAQNDQTQSENENLRDLLSRLQSENVALRKSSFTFSVPKQTEQVATTSTSHDPSMNIFGPVASTSVPTIVANHSKASSVNATPSMDNLDWNSLTAFDPSMLKLLDEPSTAEGTSNFELGFGESDSSFNIPFTTLASNQFMTFADSFDSPSLMSKGTPIASPFNFDFASWPGLGQQPSTGTDPESLDDLFGGGYTGTAVPVDASLKTTPSTLSPIVHANITSTSSSGSSPASNLSLFNTPRDSAVSDEDHGDEGCPKTREAVAKRIASQGLSPFAPAPAAPPAVRKTSDASVVVCQGSSLPLTEANDQNVEVLSAWRSITSNPKFKDFDVNELCSEFSKKARCDGTKVVLEPQGVHSIIETLSAKTQ